MVRYLYVSLKFCENENTETLFKQKWKKHEYSGVGITEKIFECVTYVVEGVEMDAARKYVKL